MSIASNTFLKIDDLFVEYSSGGQKVHAVNGISFELGKGKSLGFVGETGAGKTTVAKAIIRVLQAPAAKVTNGSIMIDGTDILKVSEDDMLAIRGKVISMIFQDPMTALNPLMTIGNQIAEVIQIHAEPGTSQKEVKERALNMLQMVGITPERYDDYPHQFSGGMKQRVVIAMALACEPELLLADEPTTALDVTIQAQVLEMIKDLRQKLNTSMILITHDLGVVAETCDDVAIIYAGQIIEYGDIFSVYDHPAHPYTRGLFNSLPSMSVDSDRLKPILGAMPDPTDLPKGCAFNPRCEYATDACRESEIPFTELAGNHKVRCVLAQK